MVICEVNLFPYFMSILYRDGSPCIYRTSLVSFFKDISLAFCTWFDFFLFSLQPSKFKRTLKGQGWPWFFNLDRNSSYFEYTRITFLNIEVDIHIVIQLHSFLPLQIVVCWVRKIKVPWAWNKLFRLKEILIGNTKTFTGRF